MFTRYKIALRFMLVLLVGTIVWMFAAPAANAAASSDEAPVTVSTIVQNSRYAVRNVKVGDNLTIRGEIKNSNSLSSVEYWWEIKNNCGSREFPLPHATTSYSKGTHKETVALPPPTCMGMQTLTLYVIADGNSYRDGYIYSVFQSGMVKPAELIFLNKFKNKTDIVFATDPIKIQAKLSNTTGATQQVKVTLWQGDVKLFDDWTQVPNGGMTIEKTLTPMLAVGKHTVSLDAVFYGNDGGRIQATYRAVKPLTVGVWVQENGKTGKTHQVKQGNYMQWVWEVNNPNPTAETVDVLFTIPNANCRYTTESYKNIKVNPGATYTYNSNWVRAYCPTTSPWQLKVVATYIEGIKYSNTWDYRTIK